jgi:hypothetical protein
VPEPRTLVAGLSPRRAEFAPLLVHVGFVVDKMALGQVFLRVLSFSLADIILLWFFVSTYHMEDEK